MAEQERQGHRWFAAIYNRMMARAEKSYMRRAREGIVGGARGRVLEIGVGTGASFSYYSDNAESIVATEPDTYMIERAKKRAEELKHRAEAGAGGGAAVRRRLVRYGGEHAGDV